VHQYAPRTLIGASGAFDTLLEIYHQRYQIATPASTTAFELPLQAFSEIYEELLSKSKEQRLSIPGMLEMRVDMIVVASCLIDLVLNQYGITNICASAYALKEGLLCKILAC
jgi:exopolyphosphatase/guanosine-5'-triphosphate,3'-diphosphate pyrophosphatase